jgi:7-carboxy-7-deazaguanine synthase
VSERKIRVSEIFGPVLQGEGALIGRPTVFVRTGGCDYRCAWCDTLYAVLPEYKAEWTPLAPEEIVERVLRLSGGHPILVTLSGGNPALAPLESLLECGRARGLTFALETQGSVAKPWFSQLEYLVLSPKGPSSGMETDWEVLASCCAAAGAQTRCCLKIVVFDEADYLFAREAARRLPELPVYLQAGTPPAAEELKSAIAQHLTWLLERAGRDGWYEVTILPQLHALLWGRARGN